MSKHFDIELEYQDYLKTMGLEESNLSVAERKQIRTAFFSGISHLLSFVADELEHHQVPNDAVAKFYDIGNQTVIFWLSENMINDI